MLNDRTKIDFPPGLMIAFDSSADRGGPDSGNMFFYVPKGTQVLGFYQLEVSQYVFRENLFLTAAAAIAGIPMGDWLLKFVIDNIVLSMIYFEPRHGPYDIPIAVALTFVFAFLVNLAMQKRLRDVSMTESLKSIE